MGCSQAPDDRSTFTGWAGLLDSAPCCDLSTGVYIIERPDVPLSPLPLGLVYIRARFHLPTTKTAILAPFTYRRTPHRSHPHPAHTPSFAFACPPRPADVDLIHV